MSLLLRTSFLPVGQPDNSIFDLSLAHFVPFNPSLRTWTETFQISPPPSDTSNMPLPFDWNLAEGPPPLLQSWTFNIPLALNASLGVPFQQRDWPLSALIPYFDRSWEFNTTLALNASLGVPFRQRDWPLATAPARDPSLLSWIDQTRIRFISVAAPFSQDDWPLSTRAAQSDRSFTSWPLTMTLPPPAFPAGRQQDWPLTRAAESFRVWSAPYIQPPTAVVDTNNIPLPFDWNLAEGPEYPAFLRSAFGSNIALLTVPVVPVPFNQEDWPLPRAPLQPAFSLTASYNLNLIGQDRLPVGAETTALPPQPAQQPTTIFTATFNKNLIGKDQLPTGADFSELPPREALRASDLRTWIYYTSLALQSGPPTKPFFTQYDWPINIGPAQPIQVFTASFNKNLIGQDKLPTGVDVTDLPPRAAQQPIQIFTATFNKNLIGQDQLPSGARSTDLPVQLTPAILQTWINQTNLALSLIAEPFAQTDWPLTPGPRQPAQSFTASYNLNLIGQDRLPSGEQTTDLPPRAPLSSIQLGTWITSVNLALLAGVLPSRQMDWPLQSDPFRAGARRAIDGWIPGINPNLFPPPTAPTLPFNQKDWPLPGAWAIGTLGYRDRTFLDSWNLNLGIPTYVSPIPPPPDPTPPTDTRIAYNPGNEWQMLDRIREPGPVGWR